MSTLFYWSYLQLQVESGNVVSKPRNATRTTKPNNVNFAPSDKSNTVILPFLYKFYFKALSWINHICYFFSFTTDSFLQQL